MTERGGSRSTDASEEDRLPLQPHLFLVLQADRPLAGGVRLALDGVDEVRLGRTLERSFRREGRTLTVGLSDGRVSSSHARLRRAASEWFAEDAGSTNGLGVNGRNVDQAALSDGDLLEVGRTFLLYRACEGSDPGVFEAECDLSGLSTLRPGLARALVELGAVSRSAVPVLLRGERGAGKELAARWVHARSGRPGPFQRVWCGGSEAAGDWTGLIRSADGGTLFLDEVADLPPGGQSALQRALEESEAARVDVRIVSASSEDLEARVGANGFRADLLARLSGFVLALPPLRERREDLGLLVAAILRRRLPDRAGEITLSASAARALITGAWPLNLRQLEEVLLAAASGAPDGVLPQSAFTASSR